MNDLRAGQADLMERHREQSHDVLLDALAAYAGPTTLRETEAGRRLLSQPRATLVSAAVACLAWGLERRDRWLENPGMPRFEPIDLFPFEVLSGLRRLKLPYAPEDAELMLDLSPSTWRADLAQFAVAAAQQALARSPGAPPVLAGLERTRQRLDEDAQWHVDGFRDVARRISALLAASAPGGLLDLSIVEDGDNWAEAARRVLRAHAGRRDGVQDVLAHLAAARGSRPSNRWSTSTDELLETSAETTGLLRELLEPVLEIDLVPTPEDVAWPPSWLLAPGNETILRGAAWALRAGDAPWVVPLLGRLALRCCASSPDNAVTTALSAPVGNGAIDSLIALAEEDGDARDELVRLLGEIRRRDVLKRIAAAVGEAPVDTASRDDTIRREKERAVRAKANPRPTQEQRTANERVRTELAPRLWALGFTARQGRTFWRHEPARVEVLHVASKRGELALEAGVWFAAPRRLRTPLFQKGLAYPDEPHCDLRARFPADDLVEASMRAEAWFLRWQKLEGVLSFLLSDESDEETWGHGAPGSPKRNYLIGYLSATAGRSDIAREHLSDAVAWHRDLLEERRSSYPLDVIAEQEAWIAGLEEDASSV